MRLLPSPAIVPRSRPGRVCSRSCRGLPAELLTQWVQDGHLWLQAPETAQPVQAAQWQAAWLQALPQLASADAVWRQTPHGSLVPAQSQGSAAAAVEYFAPSSAAR